MRKPLLAQPAIQPAQFFRFRLGQRAPVRTSGEIDEGFDLPRFGIDEGLFERGRTVVDRLAHGLEDFGVGVL